MFMFSLVKECCHFSFWIPAPLDCWVEEGIPDIEGPFPSKACTGGPSCSSWMGVCDVSLESTRPWPLVDGDIADVWSSTAVVTISLSSFRLWGLLFGAVIPPSVGRPWLARVDLHTLYLTSGNRPLTSSIVISLFSLLLRWGRGIVTKSMGSPASSLRSWRFRWLYRKQYLTPTMILRQPLDAIPERKASARAWTGAWSDIP